MVSPGSDLFTISSPEAEKDLQIVVWFLETNLEIFTSVEKILSKENQFTWLQDGRVRVFIFLDCTDMRQSNHLKIIQLWWRRLRYKLTIALTFWNYNYLVFRWENRKKLLECQDIENYNIMKRKFLVFDSICIVYLERSKIFSSGAHVPGRTNLPIKNPHETKLV